MNLAIHRPRLLPATIAAMALLLMVKSISLVRAATGGDKAGGATAEPATPAQGAAKDEGANAATGAPAASPMPEAAADAKPRAAQAANGTANDVASTALKNPGQDGPSTVSDAERSLLLDLRHRRAELDERSRELDQRNAVLSAAEAKVTARVEQLGALQSKLEQLESDRRAHDDANWTGLVHVYETMKPREAAAIFDALDMQVLLAVLDRMQPRKAAPVLAAMQPDRARLATQMLAEMRTRAITPAQAPPPAMPKG